MPYFESSFKSGFRENKLLAAWQAGKTTLNGWLAIPNAYCSEVMAHAGWDSLTIDMQHGLVDYAQSLQMLMAISTTPVVPMVRVPWLEEGPIMKALDAGAYGVICPMIGNKEDAERFARACRYPPRGIRSFGPIRAKYYAGEENYESNSDRSAIAIAMIETQEAIDNLDAILSVDGVQAIYIGPADLSLALGAKPMFDQEDPKVLSAIGHIIATAKKAGKYVGVHNGSVGYAVRMAKLGANFVTVGSDQRLLATAASKIVSDFKNLKI